MSIVDNPPDPAPSRLGESVAPLTSCTKTDGEWKTEPEAERDFDAAVDRCGLFRSYPEVWGHYVIHRPGRADKRPRIDRILVPNPGAYEIGWNLGMIGVELKASGVKVGPVFCQVLDYSSVTWVLPNNLLIQTSWIFIFPLSRTVGDLASAMVNNRIGIATIQGGEIKFRTDQTNVLSRSSEGWRFKAPACGDKIGSR
jgi:hypothetical protein